MLAAMRDERSEVARARRSGLSPPQVRQLASLIAEQSRNAWAIGDVLVAAYGPGSTSGVGDGSRRRMAVLADELGVGLSSLVNWRNTAGAWRPRDRRSAASFSLHSMLRAHPDRIDVLAAFLDTCERTGASPSVARLEAHIGDARPSRIVAVEDRLLQLARRLDHDQLVGVIDRLRALLHADVRDIPNTTAA